MKIFRIVFFVSLIFLQNITYSQSNLKLDSLIKVYKAQLNDTSKVGTLKVLFEAYLNNDLEKAKTFALEELKLSEELNFRKGIGLANLHLGVYFDYKSQLDSARAKYVLSRQTFKETKDFINESIVIRNLAIIDYRLGNYDPALKILEEGKELLLKNYRDSISLVPYFQSTGQIHNDKGNYQLAAKEVITALQILNTVDRPIAKADALNLLGDIETSQKHYQRAIDHNLEAVEIYRAYNDKTFESQALSYIGLNYYHLKNYQTSIEYLLKALEITEELNILDIQCSTLINLGKSHFELNQIDTSIDYFNKALSVAERIKAKVKIVEALNELAKVYVKRNEPKMAIRLVNRAIQIGDSMSIKTTLATSYYNRAIAHSKSKNFESAFDDYKEYKRLNDSIYDITKSQQIEELKTIYETEKKEQQIVQQETEISLLEQKQKISSLQKTLLAGGLGLTLLVFGFAIYGIRQKMKRNQLEREKLDAELSYKKKELTTHALHLAKKNEVLESLKKKAETFKSAETIQNGYQQLIRAINFDLKDDNNWKNFSKYFQEVHKDFNSSVSKKYPDITPNELRLMALLKMNLSSKEMANILNISMSGIKKARQRLRKKMNLSTKDSLEQAVLSI